MPRVSTKQGAANAVPANEISGFSTLLVIFPRINYFLTLFANTIVVILLCTVVKIL